MRMSSPPESGHYTLRVVPMERKKENEEGRGWGEATRASESSPASSPTWPGRSWMQALRELGRSQLCLLSPEY